MRGINDSLDTDLKKSRFMLYSINNNLNAETRTRLQNLVQGMLDEIAKLKEKFNLGSEEVNVKRNILGHLTEIWTTLEELRPEKIEKGYGKISEPDKKMLNLHLIKLLLLSNDSFSIFE